MPSLKVKAIVMLVENNDKLEFEISLNPSMKLTRVPYILMNECHQISGQIYGFDSHLFEIFDESKQEYICVKKIRESIGSVFVGYQSFRFMVIRKHWINAGQSWTDTTPPIVSSTVPEAWRPALAESLLSSRQIFQNRMDIICNQTEVISLEVKASVELIDEMGTHVFELSLDPSMELKQVLAVLKNKCHEINEQNYGFASHTYEVWNKQRNRYVKVKNSPKTIGSAFVGYNSFNFRVTFKNKIIVSKLKIDKPLADIKPPIVSLLPTVKRSATDLLSKSLKMFENRFDLVCNKRNDITLDIKASVELMDHKRTHVFEIYLNPNNTLHRILAILMDSCHQINGQKCGSDSHTFEIFDHMKQCFIRVKDSPKAFGSVFDGYNPFLIRIAAKTQIPVIDGKLKTQFHPKSRPMSAAKNTSRLVSSSSAVDLPPFTVSSRHEFNSVANESRPQSLKPTIDWFTQTMDL